MSNFCIGKIINGRLYDLQAPSGDICHASVANIQLLMQAEYIGRLLQDTRALEST